MGPGLSMVAGNDNAPSRFLNCAAAKLRLSMGSRGRRHRLHHRSISEPTFHGSPRAISFVEFRFVNCVDQTTAACIQFSNEPILKLEDCR